MNVTIVQWCDFQMATVLYFTTVIMYIEPLINYPDLKKYYFVGF